jgi:hypothetical protein
MSNPQGGVLLALTLAAGCVFYLYHQSEEERKQIATALQSAENALTDSSAMLARLRGSQDAVQTLNATLTIESARRDSITNDSSLISDSSAMARPSPVPTPVQLVISAELRGRTNINLVSAEDGPAIDSLSDGRSRFVIRLVPVSATKLPTVRDLSQISSFAVNLVAVFDAIGVSLSDADTSTTFQMWVNGALVINVHPMGSCHGLLSQGETEYCLGKSFESLPTRYRDAFTSKR